MTGTPDVDSFDTAPIADGSGPGLRNEPGRAAVEMTLSSEQLAVTTAWRETGRVRITRTVTTHRRCVAGG